VPAQLPVHEIALPECGLAYSVPAAPVFQDMGWTGLRQATIDLLRTIHARVGRETVAWLCPLAGKSDDGQIEHLIGLVFTFDPDEIPDGADTSVDQHPDTLGLRPAGMQPPPDMAFPAFVARDDTIHRAWIDDPEHRVCLYLDRDEANGEVHNVGVETREELASVEQDDLPGLRIQFADHDDPLVPAISQMGPDALTVDQLDLERMKIAFSWQFVYMVMNADGHVDDREKAFMARLFPHKLLAKVDLVDESGEFREPAFTIARTEALRVLPEMLEMPERVALLRTLKQAAWADGVLVPEEAEVYEAAAEMLGVPMEAVTQL
jgi:uncharacterized tellurite resistance protein B-like protein